MSNSYTTMDISSSNTRQQHSLLEDELEETSGQGLSRFVSRSPDKSGGGCCGAGRGFIGAIPLEEYRGDTLKKIHAQSSAETSGLGDSLQRIHALSSTETSGYGDGDIYYCGSPSPEIPGQTPPLHRLAPVEHHDGDEEQLEMGEEEIGRGCQRGRESSRQSLEEDLRVSSSLLNDEEEGPTTTTAIKAYPSAVASPAAVYSITNSSKSRAARVNNNRALLTNQLGIEADQCNNCSSAGSGEWDQLAIAATAATATTKSGSPHMNSVMRGVEQTGLPRAMSIDAEVSAITAAGCDQQRRHGNYHHTNDGRRRGEGGGCDGVDGSSHHHQGIADGGRSPLERSESQRSLKGRGSGTIFLGKDMSSTWLKWSQERRVSFKRRMAEMETRQQELEEQRVSTPVRKARKESVMFVSPEMEGDHMPGEEDQQIHERLQSYMPPSKARKKEDDKEEGKISNYHWNTLVMFWEHPLFIRCRVGGLVLGSIALVITIVSLTNQNWSHYQGHDYYGASYSGLWLICSSKAEVNNCTSTFHREWLGGADSSGHWQYAVIGLLVFATAFGFLATMLGVCGFCTAALPRKLYYYHSAGEIYLICAMSVLAAVLIYPIAIKSEVQEDTSHSHGLGFILAWVAIFVFDLSALCMCLDEIMRALTKLSQACKRQSRTRV